MKKPHKVRELLLTQQGSPPRMQVVRIGCIPQFNSSFLSEATWEQSLAKKKERLSQYQATREELLKHGEMCEEECVVFSENFWHSEGWTPRNEALSEAVVNQARTTRHPW